MVEGDVDESASGTSGTNKKILFTKKPSVWKDFDNWINDEPENRYDLFQVVKSAMLLQSGYTTILMDQVTDNGADELRISLEYSNFIKIVNSTKLVVGKEQCPPSNVFTLLAEIFANTPGNTSEVGRISTWLTSHLGALLHNDVIWKIHFFDPDLFRSVYWQLIFTLKLAPGDTENLEEDENYAKLLFSCFITAVMVALWHDHEMSFNSICPDYLKPETASEYMVMLISSPPFRSLSQFFLFGLHLLGKYQSEGGCVVVREEAYIAEIRQNDEEKRQSIETRTNLISDDMVYDDGEDLLEQIDRVQQLHEAHCIVLLKKGFLKAPDGFKIVQKGGRPRKYPASATKKRKVDGATISGEVEDRQPHQSPRLQKKTPRSSPKKKMSKESPINHQKEPIDEQKPSTSLPIYSVATLKPRRKVVKTADEVGLCAPIFVMQSELLKKFREEVQRRYAEGSSASDQERVRNMVYEAYDNIYHINRLSANEGPRILTSDQKLVMQQYKTTFRQGPTFAEETESDVEEEEEKKVVEVVTAKVIKGSAKSSKKFKRRY
ncbi:DUF3452 domain-containing protein [Caenorhabditis elegans]|uniref:DUF3452 domain-containing protein n=1 Tax=Caenorhabditis elegans TaxID=6239 RepID=O17689_CAEEL|nr:DUF3452 domain-containing protein [Caenorhabditis elegans]CAB02852.2 DUF3452 domain-containing protein [Caenorhabditis elegans]|eukprot:NP_001256499.1 Uncharacterized protein CELE_C50B6.3 [Caenorhabditis elegans]